MRIQSVLHLVSKGGSCALFGILLSWTSPALSFAGETACVTPGVFAVDSRIGARRVAGVCNVGYSPRWAGSGELGGAQVVIDRVDHADMFNAVTTTVTTCAVDAEGAYQLDLPEDGMDAFRILHRTMVNGESVGLTLAADISAGVQFAAGSAFAVDSRTNSLQVLAKSHGMARLAYDTGWTNDVARLSLAITDGARTNVFACLAAAAKGEYAYQMFGSGWNRFLLTFYDAEDQAIDTLVSEPFKLSGGLAIILK